MTAPIPAWWPRVVAAAGCRRHVTGRLLAHATPHLDGDTLRLTFARPDIEQAWRDSGAQEALDAALQQYGVRAVTGSGEAANFTAG